VPELPEVETVRRDLERYVLGTTVVGAEVTGTRTVRRQDPVAFIDEVSGHRFEGFSRRGKYLFAQFDGGKRMAVHLRMSGQLLLRGRHDELRVKHTHAVLDLDSGESLHFVDPRTFGELWMTTDSVEELNHIGPDALDELGDVDRLRRRLSGRRSGLKTLLMNQSVLAGIGNIYSDEILFRAGLRLTRTPDSLADPELAQLHVAIGEVLREAVQARGSSLADGQYVDLHGRSGTAQRQHRVYARGTQPCRRCDRPVDRIKVGGRSSFFCANCQS